MNEQTTQLIEQLAQKLGTTTEYLWSILVKQAPISAVIDMVYIVLIIIGSFAFWRLHRYLALNDKYDELEDLLIVPMILGGIFILILLGAAFFSIGDIINGFVNPEYWALQEILDTIKE